MVSAKSKPAAKRANRNSTMSRNRVATAASNECGGARRDPAPTRYSYIAEKVS
jgi:hypothetical protein